MKLGALLENVEIQCSITVCYYDDDKEERVIVHPDAYMENTVRYMYVEDGEIFIEVENEY